MPVRTDRGRAAALRQFWSWPLRSTRHMAVTGLAVVAVITSIAVAAATLREAEPSSPPSPAAAAATSEPTSSSTDRTPSPAVEADSASASPSTSSSAAVSGESPAGQVKDGETGAKATALGFVRHWLRPSSETTAEQWRGDLYPYVMPESRIKLSTIDPQRVPATKITGKASVVSASDAVAEVEVATDAGLIRVTVVAYPDGRWLARSWAKVNA